MERIEISVIKTIELTHSTALTYIYVEVDIHRCCNIYKDINFYTGPE